MSRDIAGSIRQQDPVRRLQEFLDARLGDRRNLDVLEAGCGSASYFRFGEAPRLVGIDISRDALEANRQLDERIVGDLETHDIGEDRFDVIVSWNVLEHLDRPDRAVERLARALRPGGLLVLGLPNLHSVKGLATKFLPHGAHVWVYRVVHRNPNAGIGANGPFRTFLRRSAGRTALLEQGRALGLNPVYDDRYDFAEVVRFSGARRAVGLAYDVARAAAGVASLGRLGKSELILVFEKAPAPGA